MSTPLRVLIVEDQEDDAALMLRELRRAQFEPEHERVETEEELTAALEKGGWEIVLSDHTVMEPSVASNSSADSSSRTTETPRKP